MDLYVETGCLGGLKQINDNSDKHEYSFYYSLGYQRKLINLN